MAKNDVEAKVRLVVDSKTYNAALRQANKEAKEFRKQQRDAFKGTGDDISKGFSSAIGVISKLAPALSAGAAALSVARKAMQENQSITDEWARATASAKSIYEGFVNSLVTANFGGYLSNMDEIISRAREAADALDALGTAQIFTDKAMTEFDLAIRRARLVIKDPNSTAEQRKAAGESIQEAQAGQLKHVKELMNFRMQAFAANLANQLATNNMPYKMANFIEKGEDGLYQIRKGSDFEKFYGSLEAYNRWNAIYLREKALRGQTYTSFEPDERGRMTKKKRHMGQMSDFEYQRLRAFMERSDEDLKESFALYQSALQAMSRVLTAQTENVEYLNRANGLTGGGGGGAGKGIVAQEGSIAYVQEQMKAATQEYEHAVTDAERKAAETRLAVLNEELNILKTGRGGEMGTTATGSLAALNVSMDGITPPKWRAGVKNYNELSATSNKSIETIKNLSDVINELGIVSNIVSPEVSKMINVLFKVIQMAAPSIPGPFGAILSVVGGIFGGGFATGGIVGGTSYKGDKLTAQVSSGEMILNRQQQRNLLSLASGGGGTPTVTGVEVHGDKMILLINNTLRGQGKHTIG